MADFRNYAGIDASFFLCHYGVGHEDGGHSGRYKWGSGDRPKQSEEKSLRERISGHFSKENRLQRYKTRALKNIDKRYDKRIKFMEDASIAQKEYSTQREAKKPNSNRIKKKDARIENEIDFEVEALKVMKSKEIEAVMNMDYSGMQAERFAVLKSAGKNWLRDRIAVGIGTVVLGPVGATIGAMYSVSHRNRLRDAKAAYRLTGSTKKHHEARFKDQLYRETRGGRYKYDKEAYAEKKKERDKKYSYALDKGEISRIRALYRSGYTQAEVAEKLGISPSSVSRVVSA